ncbi:11351_t:CDS:2 [Scutellospora calospora]|uniref:11351_t:CDS:1 n=1 Tax=Scutellospora calospora TaxID=85575 RepID=A0ACA9K8D4_9GLOM|nr:11351_t:CDS:2 [Scutellospora calospora]
MSLDKDISIKNAIEERWLKKFDYNTFDIIEKIGQGGFGKVYKVVSKSENKVFAIKCLYKDDVSNDFVREVRNIIQVSYNENIINFYGITQGHRETPINGTPLDFVKLYYISWDKNPNERPKIAEILDKLDNLQLEPVYDESNDNSEIIDKLKNLQLEPTYDESNNNSVEYMNSITKTSKIVQCSTPMSCDEIIKKVIKKYENKDDPNFKTNLNNCDARFHIACGDSQGLKLHMRNIKNNYYKSPLGSSKYFPYYDFVLFYCNPTSIISIFETFILNNLNFTENFLSIHYILQSKYNELSILESLLEFETILKWLLRSNYDINIKDKLYNNSLYYLLNEPRLSIYYHKIISIYLKNGLDPNISLSSDSTNLLFYITSQNFPITYLDLVLKYNIDLSFINSEGLNFLGYIIKIDKLMLLQWTLSSIPEFKEKQTKVFKELNALQYAMYLNHVDAIKCILVDAPIYRDAMIKNDKGLNTLGQFIQFNDMELLKWILCKFAEFRDEIVEVCEGWNALQYSMNNNKLVAIKCLLENAPIYKNPDIKNEVGLNVLGYFIQSNDLEALQWILESIPEFSNNIIEVCEGYNALQFAMDTNNIEAIKFLLEKTTAYRDISIKNNKGFNILENIPEYEYGIIKIFKNQYALEYTIINNRWEEMKCILKKAPTDKYISIKNDEGFNFLGQIIFNNHLKILQWILENIPEFKNELVEVCDGWNALQFSMNLNNLEAARCLLEKTSVYKSIAIKDVFGLNILCHAIQFNNLEMLQWVLDNIFEYIDSEEEVCYALQFAMDINNFGAIKYLLEKVPLYKDNTMIKNSNGLNILGHIICTNQLDLLEWTLDNIPKFKNEIVKVCDDRNALEVAMDINCNPVIIKCLLEKAPVYRDIKIKNVFKQNILGHIIYYNQLELLEWILKNIPNIGKSSVKVYKNYNALQFAIRQLNMEAIKCLLNLSSEYRDVSIIYKEFNVLGHIIYRNQLEVLEWILKNISEFKNEIVYVCKNYNALQYAMCEDNIEAAICILKNAHVYRDPNIKINDMNMNILGYTIRYNQLEAMKWIIKNVSQFRDELVDVCEDKNALQYAMRRNNSKAIKCIIDNSQKYSDFAIKDQELNILDWATENKSYDIIKYLSAFILQYNSELDIL